MSRAIRPFYSKRIRMDMMGLRAGVGLRSHEDIRKVVVSDDLHTVVVLTTSKTNSKNVTMYALGPQGATAMEWAPPVNSMALDIALFHGKLYVLTREHSGLLPELHVLEPRNMGIRSVKCIQRTHRDDDVKRFFFYLVASGTRLVMVGRIVYPHPIDSPMPSHCFKVFQAADLSSGGSRVGVMGSMAPTNNL